MTEGDGLPGSPTNTRTRLPRTKDPGLYSKALFASNLQNDEGRALLDSHMWIDRQADRHTYTHRPLFKDLNFQGFKAARL